MPDMWMDVDTALAEVPVNILPLTDDTDFKSREESVAYNAAGMELIWHFTTTAGATTATVVTPTTGGAYDWAHQDGGMYTIEIPASGGASINNDTEGFGHFTGVATGVLPWRGPVIGFRAAGINNALIDGAWSATRGLGGPTALPDAAADAEGGLPVSDAGGLDLDTYIKRLEAAWTAALAARIDENISAAKTLTAAYDAAKAAAPAGAKMDLVDAPNATAVTAIQSGLATAAKLLAYVKSILRKDQAADADIAGTYDATTDSLQAIRDTEPLGSAMRGTDGANTTTPPSTADIKTAMEGIGSHLTLIKAVTDAQGDTGAGLTALGDTRLANLDAAISTRSTYAGGDTAGTTTLLDRLTAIRAGYLDAAITSRLAASGYTAPPSAATVAASVWSAVSRTLTAFGFEVEATVDEEALAAAVVAAISEEGVVDEAAVAAAVVTALAALTITVQSPVASSGTITIYQGDDYVAAEGTSIAVTVAVSGAPILTGATIRLKLDEATWTATACTSDGTDWTITFEPDATATAALSAGTRPYELEATLASGSVRTLSRGVFVVESDIPAIPAED